MNRTDRLSAARRHLRSRNGLTITEMLLCVLIVGLSTALVASTLELGVRQFQDRTRDSQAEMLCNTLSLAVRDVLSCVSSTNGSGDDTLAFRTGAHGLNALSASFVVTEDGKLSLRYNDAVDGAYYPLVGDADYTANFGTLKASLAVTYDAGSFDVTVGVLDPDDQPLASKHFFVKPTIIQTP